MKQAQNELSLEDQLTETLKRLTEIHEEIAKLSQHKEAVHSEHDLPVPAGITNEDNKLAAKAIMKSRIVRYDFVSPKLFGEPAYDLLLQAFASDCEGRRETVSSLCHIAGVAQTTALRWIGVLESEGLFVREDDPADRRRTNIRLSEEGTAKIEAMLWAQLNAAHRVFQSRR